MITTCKKLSRISSCFALIPAMALAAQAEGDRETYVWKGAASTSKFHAPENWSPSLVPPPGSRVEIIGDGIRVELVAANFTKLGGELIIGESAALVRDTTAPIRLDGTCTFQDRAALEASAVVLEANSTLNWSSSGSWVPAQAGLSATTPMFACNHPDSTVNMSSGTWELDTAAAEEPAFKLRQGTFQMTGGKIVIADGKSFKLGSGATSATFHLGGTAELFTDGFQIFSQEGSDNLSTFDFQGPQAALYIAGVEGKAQFLLRVRRGNILINGERQKDHLGFSIEVVENDQGKTYTKISAVD